MAIILLSPYFFFLGFVFYAGLLNAWKPELSLWVKAILIPPTLVFGGIDILIRFTLGGLLLLDWYPQHGWTFSQALCFYYHETGYRKSIANFFAWLLNPFNEGHIS